MRNKLVMPQQWTLRVKFDSMTFGNVQDAFQRLYMDYRANPTYMFLDREDRILLLRDLSLRMRISTEFQAYYMEGKTMMNHCTGRHVYLIDIPEATREMVIFGFFSVLEHEKIA